MEYLLSTEEKMQTRKVITLIFGILEFILKRDILIIKKSITGILIMSTKFFLGEEDSHFITSRVSMILSWLVEPMVIIKTVKY